jgi:hypothetical protein
MFERDLEIEIGTKEELGTFENSNQMSIHENYIFAYPKSDESQTDSP